MRDLRSLKQNMHDFLDLLALDAIKTIESGYYEETSGKTHNKPRSLEQSLREAKGNPVIAELKSASPSKGVIKKNIDPINLAETLMSNGAAALSVLTEPIHFKGSLNYLGKICESHNYPILMKDFILSKVQVKAAKKTGASAVLLISTLYSRGYGETDLEDMINTIHEEGLEVLLETHTIEEFVAGSSTKADLIGINNRNLITLETDLMVTQKILKEAGEREKLVVSESGINSARDIRYLRECGANAFLIGSSIMASPDPASKVKELVNA